MNKLIILIVLFLYVFLIGCSPENPKTQNELLQNKKISWSGAHADYFELVADGTFISVGGDFPQEGCIRGMWESVSEDGSFKIIPDYHQPHTFLIARMKATIAKGTVFVLESYSGGKINKEAEKQYTINHYEGLKNSHFQSAIGIEATAYITRYADDLYVLELYVQDKYGRIKKILTEGDVITTEGMVTNAKKWINSPPIILPQGWKSYQRVRSTMTIIYHNGESDKATFLTTGYRDRSDIVFDDAWF